MIWEVIICRFLIGLSNKNKNLMKGVISINSKNINELFSDCKDNNIFLLSKIDKGKKVPYSAKTLRCMDVADKTLATDLQTCCQEYVDGNYGGIGVILGEISSEKYLCCIDIDHCVANGAISKEAMSVIQAMDYPYTEFSISGTGLHIFFTSKNQLENYRNDFIEFYSSKRYILATGDIALSNCTNKLVDRTYAINNFLDKVCDKSKSANVSLSSNITVSHMSYTTSSDIVKRIKKSDKCRDKFFKFMSGTHGYEDISRADMAFAGLLACFTSDPKMIEEIMLTSKMVRPKWSQKCGSINYIQYTILKVLRNKNKEVI